VNRLKTGLTLGFWLVGLCFPALAQNQQQGDAERYRLELAERARQEAEQREWETRLFQIKYVDAGELSRVLSMFRGSISYSGGNLRVLSVRAPKDIMPAIEDAIKRLDVPVPRKDAELTAYVLLASDQAEAGNPVPAAVQPVITQLKSVFAYKAYQVVDTVITRATGTQTPVSLSGTLNLGPGTSNSNSGNYNFTTRFRFESPDGKAQILRLYDMKYSFQSTNNPYPVVISADVDIPQGQQVVVGKATLGDRALILVMSSRFSN